MSNNITYLGKFSGGTLAESGVARVADRQEVFRHDDEDDGAVRHQIFAVTNADAPCTTAPAARTVPEESKKPAAISAQRDSSTQVHQPFACAPLPFLNEYDNAATAMASYNPAFAAQGAFDSTFFNAHVTAANSSTQAYQAFAWAPMPFLNTHGNMAMAAASSAQGAQPLASFNPAFAGQGTFDSTFFDAHAAAAMAAPCFAQGAQPSSSLNPAFAAQGALGNTSAAQVYEPSQEMDVDDPSNVTAAANLGISLFGVSTSAPRTCVTTRTASTCREVTKEVLKEAIASSKLEEKHIKHANLEEMEDPKTDLRRLTLMEIAATSPGAMSKEERDALKRYCKVDPLGALHIIREKNKLIVRLPDRPPTPPWKEILKDAIASSKLSEEHIKHANLEEMEDPKRDLRRLALMEIAATPPGAISQEERGALTSQCYVDPLKVLHTIRELNEGVQKFGW